MSDQMVRLPKQFRARVAIALASVLCVLTLVVPAGPLRSEGRVPAAPRAKLDVVLMFDTSGSMLATDPEGLRYEAAKLLLSFLGEGDRLGVVRFAGDASLVRELGPFSPDISDRVVEGIRTIPTEGVFTDITEGIKLSADTLEKNSRAEAQRVIVLLSDGKFEPDPSVGPAFARTLKLVQEILPELKAKEARVFTVALSEEADRPFLGEVAAATDGLTWYSKTAEELHKAFAELFLALKRPQVVQQTGRGFSIDGGVDEATFYINHAPNAILSLVSPKSEVMTNEKHPQHVTWFAGQNFDVITVKEPELGNWGVAGSVDEDGFATVLTDLKLLTDWPLVVRAGDEPLVQARLYEESKPVALPEMSGVIKFGFQIVPTDKVSKPVVQEPLSDDGSRGDAVAADGIFSSRAGPLEAGAYKLTVVAKGPTFQRSQQIPFTVRPRLVTLAARNPGGAFAEELDRHREPAAAPADPKGQIQHSGSEETEFAVGVSREAAALKSYKVSLVALSEERRVIEVPLKQTSTASRDYLATAEALPKNGLYRVKALFSGVNNKGEQIEAESPVMSFTFERSSGSKAPVEVASHSSHEGEEKKRPSGVASFPLIPLLVISTINALGFFVALRLLKTRKKATTTPQQRYLPPTQLLESIESLENRATSTTVQADDPVFKLVEAMGREDQLDIEPTPQGGEAAQISGEPG